MKGENNYLHSLRAAELERALEALKGREGQLLEIGGGDGFQASLLARRFASVESVDVVVPKHTCFPVRLYDGCRLPFPDDSFDVVFSSHAMEHIPYFVTFQREIARVLKPGGVALHIMPSAVWRFWTLLAHYPALPRLAFAWLSGGPMPGVGTSGVAGVAGRSGRGIGWWLRRVLLAMPHGGMGGVWWELTGFTSWAWRDRFVAAGWRVLDFSTLGYFYTGYVLFGGRLGLAARKKLAELVGSSSAFYLVAPAEPGASKPSCK